MAMNLNAKIFALVFGLFCCTSLFAADTLQVYAIRVQFAEESPDNSLTTGTGLFDSDKKGDYKLDPSGRRNSVSYWKKHFDFVNAYFNKASNGNVVIDAHIFPKASSAYKLKKHIIDYNRTSKMSGEKTAEFDEARWRDYLQFIYDAVTTVHESGESPFSEPLSKNPNTKRAYMIIHAGASRLLDGGSMGTRGADTPGDFMDTYIEKDYWSFLPDSLDGLAIHKVGKNSEGKDSSVVEGLVLEGASIDTLRSIMVTSETASQDGLNWGVNGILVNQVARELGLPNTYDVVKGISRLGYYDVMDFAGYNAGNGFLPSMPAAWERAYMGWNNVKEVRPVAGKPVTVEISAAGTGSGVEIVKVPLSASEYLLIENRQRSWNKNGEVSVSLSDDDESSDTAITTVPVDSLHLVFQDSVNCEKKCNVNKKKAKGIIVDMSSFDAGIPASGIVVWRVNDWYLRQTLEYGIANFWGGDTLRDHQFGIAMVEADGILSIGKTFKNALGEDTYDYGSGTDLLPHLRKPAKDSKLTFDTVTTIGSTGYANTMTTQGGYTGIKIKVNVPKKARVEKTANAFMGDSVVNFGAQKISVTISIDDGSIDGAQFPRNVGLASAVRGGVFVDDPEKEGEKLLVVSAMDGTLQVFNAMGDTLFPADTVIKQKTLTRKGSEKDVPLYRVGASYGPLVGMASDGKDVYSLHTTKLVKTSFVGGLPTQEAIAIDSAVVGPVIVDGKIYYTTTKGIFAYNIKEGKATAQRNVGMNSDLADLADLVYCGTEDGKPAFAYYVASEGSAYLHGAEVKLKGRSGEKFRLSCTDLNRDGKEEMIAVGSRGTVTVSTAVDEKTDLKWTKNYKRGAGGTSGLKDETSGIAIGDVNGDGYPEIVFLGDNLVYALDRSGLPIAGFPVKISRGAPVYGFFSDPVLVDVTGDEIPEILVPSSDGLVYAVSGKGKLLTDGFPIAAGSYEDMDSTSVIQPMSIFVTNAVSDKKSAGPELYALHRDNLSAFRLRGASADAASSVAAWTLPAGGNERTGYFDASKLGDVKKVTAKDEISEFFMFPNPVRGGDAKARFEIGAAAKKATLELYDITGLCVFKTKMSDVKQGRNQFEKLDLKHLGSDVYTARLKVEFESGKTKQKLYRVGVIK